MRVLLLFFGMVFIFTPCGARAESSSQAQEVHGEKPLLEMRNFMETERHKQEELTLLELDLEKLKVEVERKKALSALSDFSMGSGNSPSKDAVSPRPELAFVFLSGEDKEAVFNCDGVERHFKEGESVGNETLKKITSQGVVLVSRDGQEKTVAVK
ncbi:MAG: hypothetical protein HQL16_04845 [Candidatus Omnitrophica bacterium]|nr:hypothetical protein [Candidatus Omnitrophota bacterium]